jgi:hypothetical protein
MSELSDLGELFGEHDERALAALSADELTAQTAAREAVWLHVDAIWHQANADGVDLVGDPKWSALVVVRGLTGSMYERARTAGTEED